MQFLNEYLNCDRLRMFTVVDNEADNGNIGDADIEEIDELATMWERWEENIVL